MKVLVVGGAGYVGGAVTDLLAASQHETRVYDRLVYEETYRKPVNFVYGDIRDREQLVRQLEWADAVIWLAAIVGDGACALNPTLTREVNAEPVKWLAEHYNGRIVFLSTCSVYGAQEKELDESSPVNPLSVYASSKHEAEGYLENKNAIIFRLGTLFGVGDQFSRIRLDLVVNTLTVRAHHKGKLTIFGGDQFRPLLHVRDAARVIVENITTDAAGIYNIHKQNVRIIDLAYQVRNHFPDLEIETTEMRFQDTRNYRVNSQKARELLGYRSACSIDEGIEDIKALLDSKRIKDIENPRYTNQVFLSMFNETLIAAEREQP
jgi:nucleoside-diphosphate-sugar epimerase